MKQEELELLSRGITDYVDASKAIDAFRSLIQKSCRMVLLENRQEYLVALGIREDAVPERKIKNYEWHDRKDDYDSIGAKFILKDNCYKEFSHEVWWYFTEGKLETGIQMSIWARRKYIDNLKRALKRKKLKDVDMTESKSVSMWTLISAEDAGQIPDKLELLMEKWIKFWQEVGGVKSLHDETP